MDSNDGKSSTPRPLNYRSVKPWRSEPPAGDAEARKTRAALPLEFDLLLSRTQEHAAARAIEVQLKRAKIAVFRCEETNLADRWVELHIHSADREPAEQIAGRIFARRQKLKSFLRQRVEMPQLPSPPIGPWFFW